MTLFRVALLSSVLTGAAVSQAVDSRNYSSLNAQEKQALFDPYGQLYRNHPAAFFEVVPLGIQDAHPEVRRRAVQAAALILQSLQAEPQAQIPSSVSDQALRALADVLRQKVADEHSEIRGAAYAALVAAEAPNTTTESLLLNRLLEEPDDELRGAIISDMVAAGYRSDAFARAIINRFPKAESNELKALAMAVEKRGITAALPAMIDRLGGGDFAQRNLLSALRSFGKLAGGSRKKLEAMMTDPSGAYRTEIEATLTSLKNPPQPVRSVTAYQSLLAKKTASVSRHAASDSTSIPEVKGAAPGLDNGQASKTGSADNRVSGLVLAFVALAAVGLAWLLMKKRR